MSFWKRLLDAAAQAGAAMQQDNSWQGASSSMENVPVAPGKQETTVEKRGPVFTPWQSVNPISLNPNRPTVGASSTTVTETTDADRIAREEAAKQWIQHTVEEKKKRNLPISEDLAAAAGVQPTTTPSTTPSQTPTTKPATKPAPRPLSTPEAIPTPSMEDLPTLDDYNKTVSGLASSFSAELAAARKPFDEAVAKFDQEPSMENIPEAPTFSSQKAARRQAIRDIRREGRQNIGITRQDTRERIKNAKTMHKLADQFSGENF